MHGSKERVVAQERLLRRVGCNEERMGSGGVLVEGQRACCRNAAREEGVWGIQGAIETACVCFSTAVFAHQLRRAGVSRDFRGAVESAAARTRELRTGREARRSEARRAISRREGAGEREWSCEGRRGYALGEASKRLPLLDGGAGDRAGPTATPRLERGAGRRHGEEGWRMGWTGSQRACGGRWWEWEKGRLCGEGCA